MKVKATEKFARRRRKTLPDDLGIETFRALQKGEVVEVKEQTGNWLIDEGLAVKSVDSTPHTIAEKEATNG